MYLSFMHITCSTQVIRGECSDSLRLPLYKCCNFGELRIVHVSHQSRLVTRWCIMEWVKRLTGNEIETGMEIPMIESWASNIPTDKGNYVCCHKGSTDKDLHRICRNQYGHPGPAIGYWSEKRLGHVYIILEPVGSARLTFDDDLYLWVMCFGDRSLFRVPDEITDMTRSLEMVAT